MDEKTRRMHSERERRWVRVALMDMLASMEDPGDVNDIIASCAVGFKVERADIMNHSLWWIDTAARQIAMALAVRFTKRSANEVAVEFFAGRDKTCVFAARKKWDDLIDEVFAECEINAPRRPYRWQLREARGRAARA